ncbi:MAG TPA: hypothetical protein VFE60_17665 [Roseiarcus sp.]|jgi:hypothetical protein|nr:hypothetical protein [Roseiarcus sp.]
MGKRSNYKRRARDAYNTPLSATAPLLTQLAPRTRFIEPCVGAGQLVEHLVAAGHVLVSAHDLPVDARHASYSVPPGVIFVSNPPYWGLAKDLHPLIINLSDQAPAWLLLPADWLHNRSSAALMTRLRVIVSVGRVKWMPGTPFVGMENAAWYLFGRPDAQVATIFIGRQPREFELPGACIAA